MKEQALDWPKVLRRLSATLFAKADEYELEALEPERTKTKWLGAPGATESAIAAREAALGVRFPEDYRGFLLASNGFKGLAGRPHGLCSLLPVEEIGWMRDLDTAGRLAGYIEGGDELAESFVVDRDDFKRTILIGESDGNECILLLPPAKPARKWALWTYDPEAGFTTGRTFRSLIVSALAV